MHTNAHEARAADVRLLLKEAYLRITKRRGGVILNFKNPKLEWERIVL